MRKLDRYIGRTVLLSILAVFGIILGLAELFAFVDQLRQINGGYTLGEAIKFVLLTAPSRGYEMLPMAVLIGCLVGLGSLASKSELTVMRAAGVSLSRIVWAVMKPMLVVMLAGILLGEYLVPYSESLAQSGRALAQDTGNAQSSKAGLWHRQGQEYIHINLVRPDGKLLGVTRYNFDEARRLRTASFARSADFVDGQWILRDVRTSVLKHDEGRSEVITTSSQPWDIQLSPELLKTVVMDPDALSISDLWGYIHYLQEQGLNASRYWLAFWTKTLQPLISMTLVLLAISFIFGPLRSVTLGQRLFTGVLVGFSLRIVQDLLGPASQVFNFPPLLAVLLPAALCALIGAWLLKRAG